MKNPGILILSLLFIFSTISCKQQGEKSTEEMEENKVEYVFADPDKYITVKLESDLSVLSENQKQILRLLFAAAQIMDDLYWEQCFGNKEELVNSIENDTVKRFVLINYGPWDRLRGNAPFIERFGAKPKGANYYPHDMTEEEFNAFDNPDKASLYTLIRRDDAGNLQSIWYHDAFRDQIQKAAGFIREAADLAEDAGFKNYLLKRAEALLNDNYFESDLAWIEMKNNIIDFVVGPIETYEDALFGYKAAYEAFILIKDKEWSEKLAHFSELLPELQQGLPVEDAYKKETPGTESDLNAYDAVYYAGDCNAGSKTIAINLPNDPEIHNTAGSRKLQLKNSMKAKFDHILMPIADILIDPEQRKHITFDAFFTNVMFHEVGHGMGIKYLVEDEKTEVKSALKKHATTIEEGKADIFGLYLATKLREMGEFPEQDIMDFYVTFMAGIFRSTRFGAASAHGKANMLRFNYFQGKGAFTRNPETGTYKVHLDAMKVAMTELLQKIIKIQGDGDIEAAEAWITNEGIIKETLQKDLDRLKELGIPVDIVFEQGPDILGL
jgi:hypothetical protein